MRDFLTMLPDRVKVARYRFLSWIEKLWLRIIDKYLAERKEERVWQVLDFDDLPVLFDEADFQDVSTWSPKSVRYWGPDVPLSIDYEDESVV